MTDQSAKYPLDYSKTGNDTKNQLHEIANKATDQMKGAAESALENVECVTEQAREYGEKAQKVVNEFKPLVEKSLKDQPIATLAGAAFIGFVLGALWKR